MLLGILVFFMFPGMVLATPTTLIWTPSTDIQPFKKIHLGYDIYAPVESVNDSGAENHVLQVAGLTFSLLSNEPQENLLGKLWEPLGKIMAETGFDHKKGLGSYYDSDPVYFHFKFGVPEDAYFKNMPAIATGIYDMGTENDRTDNNVWYLRVAKSIGFGGFNLGRFSLGYFAGNGTLLRGKDGDRD
ncbi:MAG TPA: hypothetical protein PLU24_06275, partial [Candidatus Omnitrophota bacterium]|nr:hypothetical protein [Candidatus Omnitrophota bacterium]